MNYKIVPFNLKEDSHLTISYSYFEWEITNYLVASTKMGICAIFLETTKEDGVERLHQLFPKNQLIEEASDKFYLVSELIEHPNLLVENKDKQLTFHLKGTSFQLKVWEAMLSIPCGEFLSYKEVAEQAGSSRAFQAVGSAVGNNPIPILIPCHRVRNTNGEIGGYHYGISLKKRLLLHENSLKSALFS